MSYLFGDSFDLYSTPAADLTARGWLVSDPYSQLHLNGGATTAFGTGQMLSLANTSVSLQIACAATTSFYFSIRVWIPIGLSGTNYFSLTFQDAMAAQASVRFEPNGVITALSGGINGSVLAVATNQFLQNQWNSFQGNVVIDGSIGSITLRKNGNATPFLAVTASNTQAATGNASANSLLLNTYSNNSVSGNLSSWCIDDLFLCSGDGTAPDNWLGDMRSIAQQPVANVQSAFVPTGSFTFGQTQTGNGTSLSNDTITTGGIQIAPTSGAFTTATLVMGPQVTGNVVVGVYSALNGAPSLLIGTTATLANLVQGANTITFENPVSLLQNQSYFFAVLSDSGISVSTPYNGVYTYQVPYNFGTLPTTCPDNFATHDFAYTDLTIFANLVPPNAGFVAEPQEDGDATYLQSDTVGDEDIFSLTAIPPNYAVVGVTYNVLWRRSDAGTRTGQLTVRANGSADTPVISDASIPTTYSYSSAYQATDPTGTAWTAATVNGAHVGLKVTA